MKKPRLFFIGKSPSHGQSDPGLPNSITLMGMGWDDVLTRRYIGHGYSGYNFLWGNLHEVPVPAFKVVANCGTSY